MVVSVDTELVVRRIWITIPLQLQVLGADFFRCFRIEQFHVALEKMCGVNEDGLIGGDFVLRSANTCDAGSREDRRVGIEHSREQ